MNVVLWVMQVLLAVTFGLQGVVKFAPPPNLPPPMAWVYDMSPGLSIFVGVAEIAAALGLILPGVTKIGTRLTPLAALGLVVTMIGAIIFHIPRGEIANVPLNVILMLLAAFVAYMRWRVRPLPSRDAAT